MRTGRPKAPLILNREERRELESLVRCWCRRCAISWGCTSTRRSTPWCSAWTSSRRFRRWFAELTTKQIRRGAHRSVSELERAIGAFLDAHNTDPHPFAWTKSADQILASIARFAQGTTATQAAQLISRTTVTGH